MGKRNKKLPEVEDELQLWTLGLQFEEYHGIEEVNEKLKLQAFLVDGCYGDEEEINLGYDRSEISRADTLAGAEKRNRLPCGGKWIFRKPKFPESTIPKGIYLPGKCPTKKEIASWRK